MRRIFCIRYPVSSIRPNPVTNNPVTSGIRYPVKIAIRYIANIRALRHIRPFLDSETSETIACAIVGSRLDYVNSILTGILHAISIAFSAFKTHWLKSLLAQLPTPPQL